jgi:hypothetical protein
MAPDPTSGVSRGPCKSDFYCGLFHYLNWILILTADFSVNFTKRTDFGSGFFRLPDLDTLILTTDFYVWYGAHGRVRPVGRGCLLLHETWSHSWYIQRSVYAHSLICIFYRTYEIDYCSLFLSFLWLANFRQSPSKCQEKYDDILFRQNLSKFTRSKKPLIKTTGLHITHFTVKWSPRLRAGWPFDIIIIFKE